MQEQYIDIRNGTKCYYKDKAKTILHRLDGPAIEAADGTKSWYVNNKCHRTDGPAVEMLDGWKYWFVNDVFIFGVDSSGQLNERME